MNASRVFLGGLVGGIVYTVVSILVNVLLLGDRYAILQQKGVLRTDPRIFFLPTYIVVLFVVANGLVWLYAVSRPRLGAGPKTAIAVGLTVGLIAGIPGNLSQFAWGYAGGFVSMAWALETVLGCTLATLAGAAVYRE